MAGAPSGTRPGCRTPAGIRPGWGAAGPGRRPGRGFAGAPGPFKLPSEDPCEKVSNADIAQRHHTRLACGRPWVQSPVCPFGRRCSLRGRWLLIAPLGIELVLGRGLCSLGGRRLLIAPLGIEPVSGRGWCSLGGRWLLIAPLGIEPVSGRGLCSLGGRWLPIAHWELFWDEGGAPWEGDGC